jgi:choice-of-anchor A domain-containing protein
MIVALVVAVISAALLLPAWFLRATSGLRATVVVVLALAGLTAWAPAGGAAASGPTPQPGAQRTMAFERPLVGSNTRAPRRDLAAAAVTYNSGTGSQGFGVFVQGNATLGATSANRPIAMGGNLTAGSNFTLASQTAGTFTASGDAHPTGLLVGGSINWSGSNSGGAVNVGSSAYVKVGNMTGSVVPSNGNNPTHVVPSGGSYGSKPQVALSVAQPAASVSQSGPINFAGAFGAFASQSADMATCANSVTLTNQNGTPLTFPLSSGTNANVTLTPGTQNVLNISAANLANINTLTFNNSPTTPARA